MLVKSLKSTNGNAVPNQFAIETKDGDYFQSYKSICAKVALEVVGEENGEVKRDRVLTLGSDWDYSKTTMKYLRQFLKEYCYKYSFKTAKEIRKLISTGEIKYDPNMC